MAAPLAAQVPQTLPPTNQAMFAPLELPDPGLVRAPTGEPGEDYWQQRADYRIRATLDPSAHRVTGSETITYTNNSPGELEFLWIQLEQNLFRPGSRGALVNSGSRWRGAFPGGGVDLSRVEVVHSGTRYRPSTTIDDTRMRLDLETPLAGEGGTIDIEIDWSFVIPEYGADRMGRLEGADGWVYELAQWYPRMYVYDDVDGWNPLPYLGQGEFYLDYGTYDVEITVPRDVIVVAGGELLNPQDVLTAEQQRRMERARATRETVMIVSADEVGTAASRPSGSGALTWKYRLENARDFSWAASRAFIWDASSWEGVLLQSAYPREGIGTDENPGWERSTEYLQHTIPYYSQQWFRFPWPVAVNVAGIVGGMEYPGIVFCSVRARGQGLFGVTDHEFGHSWFPMIVGNDERRYAWMDEGFNTFINHYSNLAFYGDDAQRAQSTSSPNIVQQMLAATADQPIETYPDVLRREGLGFMAYRKPGYGLILLRELVLGPDRFDAAFKSYIRNWAYKHPKPWDFYRMMEEVSGEQLAWFWRGWFRTTETLDQSVAGVAYEQGTTRVRLTNRSGLIMPVPLEIELENGEVLRETLPAEVWMRGDDYVLELETAAAPVRVTIDPAALLPDTDRSNDTWTVRPVS
ncbi:MAG: M1 family metallopeptidase [Gemmatimonadetes bacterium]|nr:M1 family metallopeptidase [Gemmatimonadota bacterium]